MLRHAPNLLTLARIVLLVPFVQLLEEQRHQAALCVLFAGAVTDVLDGLLARRFGWHSRVGSILDPLADKLFLLVSFVALAWLELIPRWLCVLVLVRDAVIVGGSLVYWRLTGRAEGAPSWSGKCATALAMGLAVVVLFSHGVYALPAWVTASLGGVLAVVAVVSLLEYVQQGMKALRAAREAT